MWIPCGTGGSCCSRTFRRRSGYWQFRLLWAARHFCFLSRRCESKCREYSQTIWLPGLFNPVCNRIYNIYEQKIFMVEKELAVLHDIQWELVITQNKNWAQQQFDIFEHNFYVLRDCNQLLFFRINN